MAKELLLEVGCEELPAGFVNIAIQQMREKAEAFFQMERIKFKRLDVMGTPRRLVLIGEKVEEEQERIKEEKLGPFLKDAFDSEGNPTKSAIGFAKSMGIPLESLDRKKTEKGERLCFTREISGKKTKEVLSKLIPDLILSITFPKSMRWSNYKLRFARPIHWILALFGEEPIRFKLEELKSGVITYGHRFLYPSPIEVKSKDEYFQKLENAKVIVDHRKRKEMIERALESKAKESGGELYTDLELVEEVSNLVEYPFVICGKFDENFLSLPTPVLISAMRSHQRYFAIKEINKEKLLPMFLCVINMELKDEQPVVKGNERVLKARLSDARFFYEEDLKKTLSRMAEQMDRVVFQARLGSYKEKTMRIEKLALALAERLKPEDERLKKNLARASLLCKADLVSQMVCEFPELQGIMGGEYAREQGEPEEVWVSIRDHYLPHSAEDIERERFPKSLEGDILSIADKLDSTIGAWAVGLIPTGSSDPYGIRRMVLGVLHIILRKHYRINLGELLDAGCELLKDKVEFNRNKLKGELMDFFKARLKNIFLEQGFSYDLIDAVLEGWEGDVIGAKNKLLALTEFRKRADFDELILAFRRVMNILEKTNGNFDPSLCKEPAELKLREVFEETKSEVEALVKDGSYLKALEKAFGMKPVIDRFFDTVRVNVQDKRLRHNRHLLLGEIGKMFHSLADFSKVVITGDITQGGKNG